MLACLCPFLFYLQVNPDSPSQRAGLVSGDVILAVNDLDVSVLSHKQAQDVIVASGDTFRMVIQRYEAIILPFSTFAVHFHIPL